MGELEKALIITVSVVCFFSTIIFGLAVWGDYETAKLDYICTQE